MGDLLETIVDHNAMYRSEVAIPHLVAVQPPTTMDPNTGELHVEDGTRIGMTLSGRLLQYLSHPEGYGHNFPWSKALWRLRLDCRRNHPFHRGKDRPYWRGSLCHQLVIFTVIRGWSLENTGRILRYDHPAPILRVALAFIEASMDQQRRLAEKRAREEEGRALTCRCGHAYNRHGGIVEGWRCLVDCGCRRYIAVVRPPERHDQGGLHSRECPACRRGAA